MKFVAARDARELELLIAETGSWTRAWSRSGSATTYSSIVREKRQAFDAYQTSFKEYDAMLAGEAAARNTGHR